MSAQDAFVYCVYWRDDDGWHEVEFPSLTEATLLKAGIRKLGLTARIVLRRVLTEGA